MNIWMTWKNSVKRHYLIKKIFSHLNMKDIIHAEYTHAKRVYKELKH